MYQELEYYLRELNPEQAFSSISEERKNTLAELAGYIRDKVNGNQEIRLTFICTHNSRRSHISQIWAQVAADYYKIKNVKCYSGGTEVTAFNPRSVKAMQRAGFTITTSDNSNNPTYNVSYAPEAKTIQAWSKKYDDVLNPAKEFAAIMTCGDADEKCPFVTGADFRIPLPYLDPKIADDTPEEVSTYDERVAQIAIEMFYLFSII
ncbi:MAG: protein-tyrosine-phosphatase [Cyclobacteriaceae bacterium]|nr:protein-tyrosine-phosphatase [Cyclobacteriaceae bacterium]